jgi:hypothetical protein
VSEHPLASLAFLAVGAGLFLVLVLAALYDAARCRKRILGGLRCVRLAGHRGVHRTLIREEAP